MIDESVARGNSEKYSQVIARCLTDEAFKARLLADPKSVLREEGLVVPDGVEIRAVQNTDTLVHLPLPAKPTDELSDEQLEEVTGGVQLGTAGSVGTISSVCGTASTFGTLGSVGCN